jgi:cell division protein FtsB
MSKRQTRPNAPLRGARSVALNSALNSRFAGIRANMRVITILGLIVLGFIALGPQAQTWFQQRQRIADYQQQVQQAREDLAKMKVERKRWSDPIYIRSQARDRLYYVLPGEISYLVMDSSGLSSSDVSGTVGAKLASERATTKISSSITAAKKNWVNSLMQSVVRAGVEEPTASK